MSISQALLSYSYKHDSEKNTINFSFSHPNDRPQLFPFLSHLECQTGSKETKPYDVRPKNNGRYTSCMKNALMQNKTLFLIHISRFRREQAGITLCRWKSAPSTVIVISLGKPALQNLSYP